MKLNDRQYKKLQELYIHEKKTKELLDDLLEDIHGTGKYQDPEYIKSLKLKEIRDACRERLGKFHSRY